jgi:hypothetical protein
VPRRARRAARTAEVAITTAAFAGAAVASGWPRQARSRDPVELRAAWRGGDPAHAQEPLRLSEIRQVQRV